jgi:hypothetical protein
MSQDDLKEEVRYLEKKVRRYANRLSRVRFERDEYKDQLKILGQCLINMDKKLSLFIPRGEQ